VRVGNEVRVGRRAAVLLCREGSIACLEAVTPHLLQFLQFNADMLLWGKHEPA
jgi:hypothetical protein